MPTSSLITGTLWGGAVSSGYTTSPGPSVAATGFCRSVTSNQEFFLLYPQKGCVFQHPSSSWGFVLIPLVSAVWVARGDAGHLQPWAPALLCDLPCSFSFFLGSLQVRAPEEAIKALWNGGPAIQKEPRSQGQPGGGPSGDRPGQECPHSTLFKKLASIALHHRDYRTVTAMCLCD